MANEPTLTIVNDATSVQLASTIDDITSDVNALAATVATIQATDSSQSSNLSSLNSTVVTLDTRLDTAESSLDIAEAAISFLEADIAVLDALVIDVAALDVAVELINTTVASHTTSISTLTSSLASLSSSVSTINSTLSTLSSTVTTQGTDIDGIQADITAIQADIETLEDAINALSEGGDLTDLIADVAALEVLTASHTGSLNTLNSTTAAHTVTLASHTSSLSTYGAQITALEAAVDALEATIDEVEAGISNLPRMAPESLGCHDLDWVDGASNGYNFDNAPILNAWWKDEDSRRYVLDLGGRTYGIQTSLDTGITEGRAIDAAGIGLPRAESITDGGGFLWTNAASQTGPMLIYRGFGWIFRGLNLRGWYNASFNNLLTDTAHYVQVGIEAHGYYESIHGKGVGKALFDGLHISCCSDCAFDIIQSAGSGEDPDATTLNTESLGDQYRIGRLWTPHCNVGIRVNNIQALGVQVDHYEAGEVITGFHYKRGGKLKVGLFVHQGDCTTGLKLDGTDTGGAIGSSNGTFEFGSYWFDDGCPEHCKAVDAIQQRNPAHIKFGCLHVGYRRPLDRLLGLPTPIICLKAYQKSTVLTGDNGYAGMYECIAHPSLPTYLFPTFRTNNMDFVLGTDLYLGGATPVGLLTAASTGQANVSLQHCVEIYNDPTALDFNNGTWYANYQGLITGL